MGERPSTVEPLHAFERAWIDDAPPDVPTFAARDATMRLPRAALGGGQRSGLPVVSVDATRSEASDAEYAVEGKLGEGSMAEVLLAHQRSLDREVALKVVRAGASRADEAALIDEGRLAGALEHPNVLPVHALGIGRDGRPVLVMKRIHGVSWARLLESADHPFWERTPWHGDERIVAHLHVLSHVCNALERAHDAGIVHRDVKPSNVMVGAFGEVYLVDWGIARRIGPAAPDEARFVVGTPWYLAPEMAAGSPDRIDARTDVYLLGATLHEVLTGAPPHDAPDVRAAVRLARRSAPKAYAPEIPAELAALCSRAMKPEPGERPQSARAFRDGIAEHLRHRQTVALTAAAISVLERVEHDLAADPSALTGARVWTQLAEVRFGCLQSLRSWPADDAARRGLSRALALLVDRELALDNVAGASALLVETDDLLEPDVRSGLQARIDAQRVDLEARRDRGRAMERERLDRDPAVGRRARTVALGIVAACAAVVLVVLSIHHLAASPSWREIVTGNVVQAVLLVTIVLVFRRRLLGTQHNRRLWATCGGTMVALAANNLVSWRAATPVGVGAVYNLVLMTIVLALAAMDGASRLAWAALVAALSAVVVLIEPGLAAAGITVSAVATLALVIDHSRRGAGPTA
ncbi:MAG: serine/threonine protein kinase [Deltaproteobacteria bacterium]|nr:serine/threonine protein kinase [Deltaproteobacteria bacterium]